MPERKPISVTWFILSNEKRNSIRASVPRLIWLLESAAARSPGIALWFLPRFFSLLAADSAFIAYFSFKSAFQCVLSRGFSLWFLPQTPSARPREVCAPRNQQGQWEAWSSAVSPPLPLLRREVFNRESELLHCKWHFSLKKKKKMWRPVLSCLCGFLLRAGHRGATTSLECHNPWLRARWLYISSENQPCWGSHSQSAQRGPGLSVHLQEGGVSGVCPPLGSPRAASALCRWFPWSQRI